VSWAPPKPNGGSWLLSLEDLAAATGTSVERIKKLAHNSLDLQLSYTKDRGECVSRHELKRWQHAIADDKKSSPP
jgi:hypothetical protein